MKIASERKVIWPRLLGFLLALALVGCAPRIYETPYTPPPPPRKPAPPPKVSRPVFYVAATRLNLRGCPGMDCPKISVLEQNEVVEKIGEMDDWCEVVVKRDNSRGWVKTRYLSVEPVTPAVEVPPPAPPSPPPAVTPPPSPHVAPAPAPVEKPRPVKPPVVEKPKPAKPAEAPAPPKKKPEEPKPAKPVEPAPKPAPPAVKPAPPEKPAPPKEPEPEQPKKIRIM